MDAADNVAMVLRPVKGGESVRVKHGDMQIDVRALEDIALCHKIALADVAPGEAILKYGECIGEAVQAIRRGGWVHVHNIRSRRARIVR
jgi:hypothetical protein